MGVILQSSELPYFPEDVFQKSPLLCSCCQYDMFVFSNHSDEQYFIIQRKLQTNFRRVFNRNRHVYESQYGISLQLIYALTGKHITPVSVHSPYKQETTPDLLTGNSDANVRLSGAVYDDF